MMNNFDDFFSDFFSSFDVFPVYREVKTCPKCHQSYDTFRKSGKLGCAECYSTFRQPMELTLKQVQQSTKHTGKIPSKSAAGLKRRRHYEELKRKLSEAVKSEDYEAAARLHKEIKTMEQEGRI